MFSTDYRDLYKDSDVYHSDTDSEYIAPTSVRNKEDRPYPIITRSVSRRIAKNAILKKIFHGKVNRYPLRNRMCSELQPKPNYYESEDSDADFKKLINTRKRRRHSVGDIRETTNEKSSRKWINDKCKEKIKYRRYSENLALVSETQSQSDTDCSDNENYVVKEKTRVNIENEDKRKIICFTCHLRKLLNLPQIENNAEKTEPKTKKRRKSESNYNYVDDKGTHSEDKTDTKVQSKRKLSESATSHISRLECSRKSQVKNQLKVVDESERRNKLMNRPSSAPIRIAQKRKKSSEKNEHENSVDRDKRVNSTEKTTSTSETKKVPQITVSATPTLHVSEIEKPGPKDSVIRAKSMERPTSKLEAKKIAQRRVSAAAKLYVGEVQKLGESPKNADKSPTTTSEAKKIPQRRMSAAAKLCVCEIEKLEDRPKVIAQRAKSIESLTSKLEAKKIIQRRVSAAPTVFVGHVQNAGERSRDVDKTLPAKKIPQRRMSEGSMLHTSRVHHERSETKKIPKDMDGRAKSTERPTCEVEVKKIYQRRKSSGPTFNLNKVVDKKLEAKKQTKDSEKTEKSTDKHITNLTSNTPQKNQPDRPTASAKREESSEKPKTTTQSANMEQSRKTFETPKSKSTPQKISQRRKSAGPASHIKEKSEYIQKRQRSAEKIPVSSASSKISHKSKPEATTSISKAGNYANKREKSTEKPTTKSDPRQASQNRCSESRSQSSRSSSSSSSHSKYSKQTKTVDKVTNLEPKKMSPKTPKSGTSHRTTEPTFKNSDNRRNSIDKGVHASNREKSNERPSTSHKSKGVSEKYATPESKKVNQGRTSECGSSHNQKKEYSKNAESRNHSKEKSSEKPVASSELKKSSQKRKFDEEKSSAKEHEHARDRKKSSGKGQETPKTVHKKVSKDKRSASEESSHKDRKIEPKNAEPKKYSTQHRDKKARSAERTNSCAKTNFGKKVSFETKTDITLKPILKKVADRRKSESAASISKSGGSKEYTPNKKQKRSCEDEPFDCLKFELKDSPDKQHHNEQISKQSDFARRGRRTFNLNITSLESNATDDRNNLSPVISIHTIASSDEDTNPSNEVFLTPEEQLKEIFHDTMEFEQAREELIRILDTSSENLGAACEKSLISDMVQSCLISYSSRNGSANQIVTVVDNCGKHSTVSHNDGKESELRNIFTRESYSTDTIRNQFSGTESDEEQSDMTKMEHYKKRLIQQHEKPTLMVSPPATTEDDDSSSQSPLNSNQGGHQQKKKEEAVQVKVAKKRSVCRSKFRHQNLEFFKLGNSIPTSLCKTKEPYNICAGKNLQMCNQNQSNKKCDENVIKESITESIINTMEGNKRKDILWRSVSLNNEQQEKKTKSSNTITDSVKNNSGRHILPAIVPEIPDRRKIKTSNSKPSTNEKTDKVNKKVETDLVIHKADPVSINKRKSVVKRRKTAIGIENSETDGQSMDTELVSDFSDTPTQETSASPVSSRRKSVSTESEISENSPINLSLKKNEHRTPEMNATVTAVSGENQQLSVKQILLKYTQAKAVASQPQQGEPFRIAGQRMLLPAVSSHNNEIERSCNTMPQSMSAQNQESARNYISKPNADCTIRPRTLQSLSDQNHESAATYMSMPNGSTAPQNFKRLEHHVRPPTSQAMSAQSHDSARNYISAPNGPSTTLQNHESTRNYFVGPSKPPSSLVHEPPSNYTAGMSKPPAASSQNYEPGRNFAAGTNQPSVAVSQNHEVIRNGAPTYSHRNQESARNYFPAPSASNNGPYYHRGVNFPEIQQQMMRLDNTNAIVPLQNHLMQRHEKTIQQDYRSVNPPMPNHEEVINTIIQLVKSSMDPIFSVEILLILNKWYIELNTYCVQPGISKKTKTAIMRTLSEILFYISEKLFNTPCNLTTRNYIEQIIQIVSPHHKDLFNRLLPMLSRKYKDKLWMSNFFKLLSQSPPPDSGEHHNQRPNVSNNHQNLAYSVPVPNHNFPPPQRASQNYCFENYLEPPLPPYQGYNCQNNSLQGNYIQNMEQHQRNGMLLPYPNNRLEAAMEMQLKQQQNIQAMYQNAPQNFPRPENYNMSVSALARPTMYLADNRCVPPNYGPNPNLEQQMLRHLPEQNKVSKYKSKKKDRLEIIPIAPTNSPVALAAPNIKAIHEERPPVTNKESLNHEDVNDQGKPKRQKKIAAAKKGRAISRQNSETSTSSSNVTDHNTAPDVEELLQTNFIYNKSKTDNIEIRSIPSTTKIVSTTAEPSATNVTVGERTVENVIINVINNSDNNSLEQEKTNITVPANNTSETNHTVASTVIVKDKSMEITRGNSYRDLSVIESTVDQNVEEISNDIVLEKVDLIEDTNDTSTSSDKNLLDDKQVIKENIQFELHDLSSKMREKLLLCGDNNPEVKLRLIKEVFGDQFKEEYEDIIQVLLFKRKQEKIGTIKVDDDVIMIDDDEDIEIEKLPKKEEDEPPKLIRLSPLKRKEDNNDEKQPNKKLRTAPIDSDNKDIVIIEDEEKDEKPEDILNSDCNQNFITTVDQNINISEETGVHKSGTESNPVTTDCNTTVAETIPPAPERPIDTSVVTNINITELTDSPIVNKQPLSSTVVPETPLLEDISSDEDTRDHFSLRNHYEKKLSGTMLNTLEVSEVSHCDLINDTVDSIDNASNHEFFEKPLVYTRPVTPKKTRKYSTESETTTSTVSKCSNEPESAVEIRKWTCLANITHYEEDDTLSTSYVSVQPSWDQNYSLPKNAEETDILTTSPYRVPVSPSVSTHFLQDSRYPRVSPVASPNKRFSPNFKLSNRSVPVSPSFSVVSTASSVVPTTSSVVSATTPVATITTPLGPTISPVIPKTTRVVPMSVSNNSSVNWQDWFAQEKSKGFFNFSRSQSVESENLNKRQSEETISSDYCPKLPLEDNYCEIKVDSKTYRIKRSVYERIPKGKLCYVRDNNTFIRYFDGSQMELFMRNLNVGEGSSIASDLLKQIKGRVEGLTDFETSLSHYEASRKSEVITITKDVTFSTEDYLSDPELYVVEVEKVQRFVPKDFYGFYKYVTGYQIVNHHPPISFQTFLTMHNTNGIRGLFKSYVNTLIEGHAIL